jgi:hypothetical protein
VTRIEIGITHEVVINGDKSWVRLAISDDYDIAPSDPTAGVVPNRVHNLDEAVSDLSRKVNQKLLDVVEQTVETVTNYTKEQ